MGTAAERMLADLDAILDADDGVAESIDYQVQGESGPEAWRAYRAIVLRGDASAPLELGSQGKRGPDPITVTISRSDVPTVRRGRDRIRLSDGAVYQVKALLDSGDPALWRLYAVVA